MGTSSVLETETPRAESAIIDLTEAAYDLEVSESDWLPNLLRRGLPILDHGLGVAGWEYGLPPNGGDVEHRNVHVASGPSDFAERHMAAIATIPRDVLRRQVRSGLARTGWQEVAECGRREEMEHYLSHVSYCKDVLYLTAVDAQGAGVSIVAPLAEVTTLSASEAHRWQMVAAHVEAGHRLREAIALAHREDRGPIDLPQGSEAVLDPRDFRIAEAVGPAKPASMRQKLREAAVAIDRARGPIRKSDPQKGLEGWKALVHGRWSVVDWFDTDGRRFVLAIPNSPGVVDPRGLTERESQIAWMAAAGMTNKLIAYRLGLSTSRISLCLRTAMRKLGVQTRTQLVRKIQSLPDPESG
ncbi:MAG: helix-turn-helix transcriptional regulator [Myxococcales bacterium]|jgi:DNA-binding CsgD family transcriptional regulator